MARTGVVWRVFFLAADTRPRLGHGEAKYATKNNTLQDGCCLFCSGTIQSIADFSGESHWQNKGGLTGV